MVVFLCAIREPVEGGITFGLCRFESGTSGHFDGMVSVSPALDRGTDTTARVVTVLVRVIPLTMAE